MKKFTALLILFIACLTSNVNAQCPNITPSFTIQRISGNSFRFINTSVNNDTTFHPAYTWTFGDGGFNQTNADTVTYTYTNTELAADSVNSYSVSLEADVFNVTDTSCHDHIVVLLSDSEHRYEVVKTDTVRIAICNTPVIVVLPDDSVTNGTVLDYLQLNNAQIGWAFAWIINGSLQQFEQGLTGYKVHAGDTVLLWETMVDNSIYSTGNPAFLCSSVASYVVPDTNTTGIFSPAETVNADIYSYHKEVTVTCDNDIKQVNVYDLTGRLVFESAMNGTRQTFSLTHLTDGVYIVSARTATGKVANKKVMLQ